MKIKDFLKQIQLPIFTAEQANRILPETEKAQANVQFSRWMKRGELRGLRRGLYMRVDRTIDEMVVANSLYQPSYISMETVLNTAGIMPDVSAEVTSITTGRPKKYITENGVFSYSKIARSLFFYEHLVESKIDGYMYKIASPEKALLDWMYVRRVHDLTSSRIGWNNLDGRQLIHLSKSYPNWVRKEIAQYV